jgi:tryptophan halogenase
MLRALRHRKLAVTVLDTGPAPDAPLGFWTLPSQRGVHTMLGIRETDLLFRTGATFKLATEYLEWGGARGRFLHAHGEIGTNIGGMPFYKYLQKVAIDGHPESPEKYSIAAIAANMTRFARPREDGGLTSSFTYGFHLEEAPYVAMLRELAEAQGVRRLEGVLAQVACAPDGNIEALELANGERLEGDLFLDCTGRRASLMTLIDSDAREDWSTWLPCDRMYSAFASPKENPPALTRITASDAGWLWWAPLAQSSMVGHVYSSAHLSDDEALSRLRQSAPALTSEPRLNVFCSGKRKRPWLRNCVAIGEAAVELEPLVGAQLHFAQLGIGTLLDLFPLDTRSQVEAVEYNRIVGEHADALRDFTLAHYHAGPGRAGRFWEDTRSVALPARLADKLELYGASGRIVLLDYESFEELDWAWLLLGRGCLPATLEAQIHRLMASVTKADVAPLHQHLVELANTMPPHAQFLRPSAARGARPPGP